MQSLLRSLTRLQARPNPGSGDLSSFPSNRDRTAGFPHLPHPSLPHSPRQLAVPHHSPLSIGKNEKLTPKKRGKKNLRRANPRFPWHRRNLNSPHWIAQARGFWHRSALPRPRIRFLCSIWPRSLAGGFGRRRSAEAKNPDERVAAAGSTRSRLLPCGRRPSLPCGRRPLRR